MTKMEHYVVTPKFYLLSFCMHLAKVNVTILLPMNVHFDLHVYQ